MRISGSVKPAATSGALRRAAIRFGNEPDQFVKTDSAAVLNSQMDVRTGLEYARNAQFHTQKFDRADGGFPDEIFRSVFLPGASVLDIGAGSGRDMARLLELGCEVQGVEPVAAFREEALRLHPELAGHLKDGALPRLDKSLAKRFDAILCASVLMELPETQLTESIRNMKAALKTSGGKILMSVPTTWPDLLNERDSLGRLFHLYPAEKFINAFKRQGFQLAWEQAKPDNRPNREGRVWHYFVFELPERPIEN